MKLSGEKSEAASAVALGVPGVPQNVSARATGDKQITLTWDAVDGATQYNVYRWNGSAYKYYATTYAANENPTQYVNKGLTVGTEYSYRVVAVSKAAGPTLSCAKSEAAAAAALGKPGVPQNVAAVSDRAKTATVSWDAVTGATQYNVYRYDSAKNAYVYIGTTFADAAEPTRYTAGGLTSGAACTFKVLAAVKGEGLTFVGEKSAAVSVTVK